MRRRSFRVQPNRIQPRRTRRRRYEGLPRWSTPTPILFATRVAQPAGCNIQASTACPTTSPSVMSNASIKIHSIIDQARDWCEAIDGTEQPHVGQHEVQSPSMGARAELRLQAPAHLSGVVRKAGRRAVHLFPGQVHAQRPHIFATSRAEEGQLQDSVWLWLDPRLACIGDVSSPGCLESDDLAPSPQIRQLTAMGCATSDGTAVAEHQHCVTVAS
mmetsp:Transcript_93128/g.299800  ORF Transcript_93128/g.299800 Transcript_93128/m.299800 type:complete len:216 (+) Transcript_93128:305-952(+)